MKPWLGAQEVLYESLLWHLKVPKDYASQVAANKLVFPGESMVNIANPPNTHSAVNLEGYVDAWITDIECATSLRPRLYGFDYGRVADIFYQGDDKVLLTTKPQDDRKATGSIPSEKAMMKDLMLSCYAKGGEICLSYHMLNPFIAPADSGLDPLKYHTGQSDTHLGSANFQSEFAAQSDTPTPSDTVTRGGREMGTFLEELLSHPMADGNHLRVREAFVQEIQDCLQCRRVAGSRLRRKRFIEDGFSAVIICLDPRRMPKAFDLPANPLPDITGSFSRGKQRKLN